MPFLNVLIVKKDITVAACGRSVKPLHSMVKGLEIFGFICPDEHQMDYMSIGGEA